MDLLYVDVFGNGAFTGNPLAVVKAEATLDARQMQTVAAWLNLSETAFLLPPEDRLADYRVRIFTPRQELSFAGHPSVGAAWAAIHWRLMPSEGGLRMQQCGAGLLPVRVDDPSTHSRIHVKSPTARLQTTIEPQRLLEMTRTALGTPLVGQAQIDRFTTRRSPSPRASTLFVRSQASKNRRRLRSRRRTSRSESRKRSCRRRFTRPRPTRAWILRTPTTLNTDSRTWRNRGPRCQSQVIRWLGARLRLIAEFPKMQSYPSSDEGASVCMSSLKVKHYDHAR